MAYTTINKHKDYFNTKLYTGNGSTQSITGIGHQPDMVWNKARNATEDHALVDAVRGVTKTIYPSDSAAEQTRASGLTAFGTDGYTVGNGTYFGNNGTNYVSWNWKAGTTTTGSGTGKAYSYSVSTTAGFSIVKYVGNGTSGHTIPHHLGVAPSVVMIKNLTDGEQWRVGHTSLSSNFSSGLHLSLDNAAWTQTGAFNDTGPSSTVFTVGNFNSTNGDGDNLIAYCFAPITGYSSFGSYKSSGYSDGPFSYTGMKPKFLLIKNTSDAAEWEIYDSERIGYNDANYHLNAQDTSAEATLSGRLDLLSNGFKIKVTNSGPINSGTAGKNYVYFAFGQSLVGSNNVPCVGR
mgnify:CR=1 FL=1